MHEGIYSCKVSKLARRRWVQCFWVKICVIRGCKNFLIFLNIPLDVIRICDRIAILDGQAMFIPRCLAIGVFTRHKLFFNKLTVMPNSSESAYVTLNPTWFGVFSTFDVCAK
jgi:hypothetical protein